MRAIATTTAMALLLCGCGKGDSPPSIMGSWEQIGLMRPGYQPVRLVEVTFRGDGVFTARYEAEGTVTSVVGAWERQDDWSAKHQRDSYRVRLGMVNGKSMPAEVFGHGVEAFTTDGKSLWFPMTPNPATGWSNAAMSTLHRPGTSVRPPKE